MRLQVSSAGENPASPRELGPNFLNAGTRGRGSRCYAMPRKLIHFHPETLTALKDLAADRMASVQELADEAFTDLLRKHRRPVGLKAALQKSSAPEQDNRPRARKGH